MGYSFSGEKRETADRRYGCARSDRVGSGQRSLLDVNKRESIRRGNLGTDRDNRSAREKGTLDEGGEAMALEERQGGS
jgi:hypothetical protein